MKTRTEIVNPCIIDHCTQPNKTHQGIIYQGDHHKKHSTGTECQNMLTLQALVCVEISGLNRSGHTKRCHKNPETLQRAKHNAKSVHGIVCIGVSTLPQKHYPLLSCQAPLKSTNCPSPLFQAIPPSISVFREPPPPP